MWRWRSQAHLPGTMSRASAPRAPAEPPAAGEIRQRVAYTVIGLLSAALLALLNAFMLLALAMETSASRLAAFGTVWIAGNVLFGLGVALGRRSTYTWHPRA